MTEQRLPKQYSYWLYPDPNDIDGRTIIEVMGYGESGTDSPWYIKLYYYSLNGSSNNSDHKRPDIPSEINTRKGFNVDRFWELVDSGRLIPLLQGNRDEIPHHEPLFQPGDRVGRQGA